MRQFIITIIVCLMVFLFGIMINSCAPIKTVTEYRDREVERVQYRTDSIYLHDSVYVRSNGDTCYVDRWRTKYAYKYLTRTDSVVLIDSIPYPVEVVKYQTKRSGYDRFCSVFFWAVLLTSAGYICVKLYLRR